ncbi:MAG: hypothetical protein K0U98_26440 [Deltaproteobacteria bacterium]|nr:hypothetical protein [Deltaproteobacteria bacterium]
MSADEAIKQAMAEIPKAVAAGVVDLASGMMLSIKTVDSHPQEVLDLLGPATQEMFEGAMVDKIETLFKKARGVESDEHYFQEILISSTHLWHYFGRMKKMPQAVLTVVARGDVTLGVLVTKARQITETLEI